MTVLQVVHALVVFGAADNTLSRWATAGGRRRAVRNSFAAVPSLSVITTRLLLVPPTQVAMARLCP